MVRCINCNHENPDSFKFCLACGAKLPLSRGYCPNCNVWYKGAIFCGYCGEDLLTEYEVEFLLFKTNLSEYINLRAKGLSNSEESNSLFKEILNFNPGPNEVPLKLDFLKEEYKYLKIRGLGDSEKGITCLDNILKLEPFFEEALIEKVKSLNQNDYDVSSLIHFNNLWKLHPEDEELGMNVGILLFKAARYEEALNILSKILNANPNNDLAFVYKGKSFNQLGGLEKALECFNKALEVNPQNEIALSDKGEILRIFGELDEALECFNKALEVNPQNESVLYYKAKLLVESGKNSEALTYFDKLIDLNPTNKQLYRDKATVLDKMGLKLDAKKYRVLSR